MFGRKQSSEVAEPARLGPCRKHSFDRAVGTCERCASDYCQPCLVYPHGPRKKPFCIDCALVVAGVRR